MDTEHYTYGDLADEINLETGGMSATVSVYPSVADDTAYEAKFEVRTKMLYNKLPKALSLLEEILCHTKISDEKRLQERHVLFLGDGPVQ